MKKILLLVGLLPGLICLAQNGSVPKGIKLKPFASLTTGLLIGATERDFLGTATAGISIKQWGIGIGGGIDAYWMETYPVFLQVNYQFKERWLVAADVGLNLVRNKKMMLIAPMAEHDNGWYTSAQINYKLFNTKWFSCFAGAGYSIKTYESKEPNFLWWSERWVDRRYQFSRATMQVAFRF